MTYNKRGCSGFSMIEVLVTTVILALGILGTSALQIMGLKGTDAAHYRTVATFIANDMAERIRMNPPIDPDAGAKNDMYETDTAISCNPIATEDCNEGACTAMQLAVFDQTQLTCGHATEATTIDNLSTEQRNNWNNARKSGVRNSLPNGSLTIDCGAGGCGEGIDHHITIAWTERADTAEQSTTTSNIVITITP